MMRSPSTLLRRVLAALELVAHHGHLGGQSLALDRAMHQAVGFEGNGELQVVVARRQRLEIIGAVGRCGAVELCAAPLQCLRDVRV